MSWRPDLTREQRLELLLRRVRNDPSAFNALSKPARQRINQELKELTV
jgi:hypothetical protein